MDEPKFRTFRVKTIFHFIYDCLFYNKKKRYFTNRCARSRCRSSSMTAPNRFYQREQKLRGSAYYMSAGAIASVRPTFFIFAVSPGRKITTSFPRSNPECRRSRVSAWWVCLSFLVVCVRCTVARARAWRNIHGTRKASRRWASCVTSKSVGMHKYTIRGERRRQRRDGDKLALHIRAATLNL